MRKQNAHGFVLPAAIFLLVVLGGLAGWMVQLTQATHAQDALAIESERAYRAAEAGLEAGIYAARQAGTTSCTSIEQAVTFPTDSPLSRFTASVSCQLCVKGNCASPSPASESEGIGNLYYFRITSISCNQADGGTCPNPTPTLPEYAERQMRAVVEGG
jgi:MSHA biogenesis protein MshP